MKRRALLSSVSSSVAAGLAGCLSLGQNVCVGETWTGLSYDLSLNDISYNETNGQWEGKCSLSVSFSFVYNTTPGIRNAGIALYSDDGHRTGLIDFGDISWTDVPEDDRSTMDCGGYEAGGVTRTGEFTATEFPTDFALWYAELRTGVVDHATALTYNGAQSSRRSPEPSQWKQVHPDGETFPSVPDHTPALGDRIKAAKITTYGRNCSKHGPEPRVDIDTYCCQLSVSGSLTPPNIQYVPAIKQAEVRAEDDVLDVTVQMRSYRRPPAVTCDSPRMRYTVGVDLEGQPPGTVAVTHRDAEGNHLSEYQVETGVETATRTTHT